MKSFLQRVLPGVFGAEAQTAPAAPPPPTRERRANPPPEVAKAVRVMGARRPLISTQGDIVGFEYRIGDDVLQRLQRRNDQVAQTAHVAAALASARLTMQTGRIGFAREPASWVVHVNMAEAWAGAMIGLQTDGSGHLGPDMLKVQMLAVQHLREAGAKVGWERSMDLPMEPDFVLLRQGKQVMAELLGSVQRWPKDTQALPIVLSDIANVEDLELALQHGVAFACGALAPSDQAQEKAEVLPVPPEVRRVGYLLNLLVTGADTAAIVREIKGDVGLSFRILKRLNSASFAQLKPVASIDQAVLLLGRNELYRWLSLVLMQFAGSRKASSALQEIALWRSRLLELLALERNEPSPDQLFTLGLASMLGLILKMGQEDIVTTLNLPEQASQALLEHSGPWLIYLQIAKEIEAHSVGGEESVAAEFGGAERVLQLADEAWAWGAENAERASSTEAGAAG